MNQIQMTQGLTANEAIELTQVRAKLEELELLLEQRLIATTPEGLMSDPAFHYRLSTLNKRRIELEQKVTATMYAAGD
jgi:hypothetical protein